MLNQVQLTMNYDRNLGSRWLALLPDWESWQPYQNLRISYFDGSGSQPLSTFA
jgi:hypothetical protein